MTLRGPFQGLEIHDQKHVTTTDQVFPTSLMAPMHWIAKFPEGAPVSKVVYRPESWPSIYNDHVGVEVYEPPLQTSDGRYGHTGQMIRYVNTVDKFCSFFEYAGVACVF